MDLLIANITVEDTLIFLAMFFAPFMGLMHGYNIFRLRS